MIPAIFPGDLIHVRIATPEDLVRGAIVCYPNGRAQIVAHRIVAVRSDGQLEVRGDAQRGGELIPSSAITHIVVGITGRLGHWVSSGKLGRFLEHLALTDRTLPRLLKFMMLNSVRTTAKVWAKTKNQP